MRLSKSWKLHAGVLGIVTAVMLLLLPNMGPIGASVFGGSSIQEGIQHAAGVGGISNTNANEIIENVIGTMLSVTTTLAVFTIVIAGMFLVLSIGEEGQKDKAKKIIQYTVIGLAVILLAEVIIETVKAVISGDSGTAQVLVTGVVLSILSVILNVVTTLAVLMIVVAGLYLILSLGEEGQKDKAKKIILYCIIGIVIILFSRAIVVFVNSFFG